MTVRLPPTVERCTGVREGDTVRPVQQCQQCLRWQHSDDYAPRFVIVPGVLVDGRLQCDQRIAQG